MKEFDHNPHCDHIIKKLMEYFVKNPYGSNLLSFQSTTKKKSRKKEL
jgi:hypothetical protein